MIVVTDLNVYNLNNDCIISQLTSACLNNSQKDVVNFTFDKTVNIL